MTILIPPTDYKLAAPSFMHAQYVVKQIPVLTMILTSTGLFCQSANAGQVMSPGLKKTCQLPWRNTKMQNLTRTKFLA